MALHDSFIAQLKEVRLLSAFSDIELSQLVKEGVHQSYESHSNIVIEGELTWGLYIILEGMVGIFKTNKLTGEFYDIGQLSQGGFFGEMSLVDDNPRSATVRALTSCRLFYVSKEVFQKFLSQSTETHSRFYQNCIKTLVDRLRELDDNYVISQYQLWKVALKKKETTR